MTPSSTNREFDADVLCLSPHPDDVEFSMGLYIRENPQIRFHVMAMSSDGAGGNVGDLDRRHHEMKKFWDTFGGDNVVLTFNVGELKFDEDDSYWVSHIERYVEQNDISAVFVTPSDDAHWEHRYVRRMVEPALRRMPVNIIEYKCVSTRKTWLPNYFWETIEGGLVWKHECLVCSVLSQNSAPYFQWEVFKDFHRDEHMSRKGIPFSEQFRIVEIYDGAGLGGL